jgi:hypothetical protein
MAASVVLITQQDERAIGSRRYLGHLLVRCSQLEMGEYL